MGLVWAGSVRVGPVCASASRSGTQQPQEGVLRRVDVLVLVDTDVRPAVPQGRRNGRLVAEQRHRQFHQAVEIHQVASGERLPEQVAPRRVAGGVGEQRPARARRSGEFGGHCLPGLLVGDAEIRRKPGSLMLFPQDHQAEAVEGGHGQPGGLPRDQGRQPLMHLLGRPPGEGDREA